MSQQRLTSMPGSQWQPLAAAHADRTRPWIEDRLARRAEGRTHAVDDFLFDYYPFSPNKLATWHPGFGVVLEGRAAQPYLTRAGYRAEGDGVTADLGWLEGKRPRLDLAIRILAGTASRAPMTGCFGLHEWAMVYGQDQDDVRHAYLPLRVTPSEIARTVDEVGLRCTHIDAYRFFTPQSMPLNPTTPTRETQPDMEQPGCLHAGMDLYKYAFWFSPLAPSDLIMDCFENAAHARELDMRASPYDVSQFGLPPIRVETPEGRMEYFSAQRRMMLRSGPLRERLHSVLVELRDALALPDAVSPAPARQAQDSPPPPR